MIEAPFWRGCPFAVRNWESDPKRALIENFDPATDTEGPDYCIRPKGHSKTKRPDTMKGGHVTGSMAYLDDLRERDDA